MPNARPTQTGHKKAPDQVRRRNTTLVTNLPPEGRTEPAPPWPLEGTPTAHEKRRWAQLWTMPQAVIWDQWHLERIVARYVRVATRAEEPDAGTVTLAEARRLEIELGMTPKAILSLQWTLADPKPDLAPVLSLDDQLRVAQGK